MEAVLYFIVLKIIEISSIIFIPYFVGWVAKKNNRLNSFCVEIDLNRTKIQCWGFGFMLIFTLFVAAILTLGVFAFFQWNWGLAQELAR